MSESHLDRKELKRPDAFQEKAGAVAEFLSKNTKALALAGVALLVVVAGMAFYSSSKKQKNEQANNAFYNTKKEFVIAASKAPKTDANWEQTLKGDISKLEEFAKNNQGTQAAFEAYLLLGDTYYERDSFEKASEYFKQATANAPSRSMKALAQHSLAYSFEGSKKHDEAIEQLRQVLASGEKPLRGDALMALARNFQLKGDKPKAVEQYDQVIKDFPNSALAKAAEAQKSALR